MGILTESYGVKSGPAENTRCKRDYEKEIKGCNEKLTKASNLKEALFDYCGVHASDAISTMIGELVMEERRLSLTIETLINEQEKEK
uniref:Uncharacterized protein n=1 Tax=viral metagenome TaxID=1070528 RepID=A0A6M3L0Y0_9ZZZZ